MRVVFMGTPDFSVPVLESLVAAGHDIAAVYCQPPRPAGRGKKLRASPVQSKAEGLNLIVRYPTSLKTPQAAEEFAALDADVAVVVAYGLILPQAILDAPRRGCLNIHASELPRWRGAAPIHRAIMAGDETTGICIMQMEAGLDTGPVLLRTRTPVRAEECTGALHDRLSVMGADLIVEALQNLDTLTPMPQSETGVTYATKITKDEAKIGWTKPAQEVDRQIRGLSPFPGAWCMINDQRVKLLGSQLVAGQGKPGVTLDNELTVACGTGAIRLTRLQRAGKGAQDQVTFLRGWPVTKGTQL